MSASTPTAGPQELDLPDNWIEIHEYRPAVEVLRNRTASANTGGASDACFRAGILLRSDPPVHTQRRKIMNRLMRRDGHRWFRDEVLYPTVEQRLDALTRGVTADAPVEIDLVDFGTYINLDFAAALIGLTRARTPEGAKELLEIHYATFVASVDAFQELRLKTLDQEAIDAGLAAVGRYRERFFDPAYADHEELVRKVETGEMAEEDLPHDLLTLLVAHADPAWADKDLAVRESTALMRAAIHTSTQTLCSALEFLDGWFAEHPEDFELRFTPEFLLRAMHETLRINTVIPAFIRRATEEITLSDGRVIPAGTHILLRTGVASRDPSVFGEDADRFNPRREVPTGVYPYGLAFNTGTHMCYGIPMVLGSYGTDGSLVHLLRELYRAGATLDPQRPPKKEVRESVHHYESFQLKLNERVALPEGVE
jgi:cytochrome P450